MRFPLLVASAMLVSLGSGRAQDPPPPRPWGVGMEDVIAIGVPQAVRGQLDDLEYEATDTIKGLAVDLNGDGVNDYVVQAAPSLCGNGGCPYGLFDGATGKALGQIAGSPLVVRPENAHGFPIIEAYGHLNAESATYTTYTFDGTAYVATLTRTLQGAPLDSLEAALRRISLWRPRQVERDRVGND
jgi:hypothetical protein